MPPAPGRRARAVRDPVPPPVRLKDMSTLHRLALLLALAPAAASCGAEPPPPPAAPIVVEFPQAVAMIAAPPPAEPGPAKIAAPALEDEPIAFHCAGGELLVAGDRPYCVQKAAMSYDESERWCAANGGHLARIGSDEENRALMTALGSPVGFEGGAWFGLVSPAPGRWLWSTGKQVAFTRWAPGEPNNAGGDENCGELYAHSAGWNDLACARRLSYLCESRPARRGATPPKLTCGGKAFRAGGIDYCYEPGQALAWIDAEHACKKQGGTLASFERPEEVDAFVAAINGRLGFDRAWIGFTDEVQQGRWTTVTGHRMRYSHWRPGEPNNAGGHEHCAEWYTADGGWNDIQCEQPHVGICAPR